MSSVVVRYPCRAINGGSVQYTTSGSLPYILLFTRAHTRGVWFDVTIIDINNILLTVFKEKVIVVMLE